MITGGMLPSGLNWLSFPNCPTTHPVSAFLPSLKRFTTFGTVLPNGTQHLYIQYSGWGRKTKKGLIEVTWDPPREHAAYFMGTFLCHKYNRTVAGVTFHHPSLYFLGVSLLGHTPAVRYFAFFKTV